MFFEKFIEQIAREVFWKEASALRRSMMSGRNRTPTIRTKLDFGAETLPVRAHDTDAGADLLTPETFTVDPHGAYVVDTGVHIELPSGTAGFIKAKSGLNIRFRLLTDGLVDEGYTGSIKVAVYNHGELPYTFNAGDKLTQLVVVPVLYPTYVEVDEISGGDRGDNGFGSTGC